MGIVERVHKVVDRCSTYIEDLHIYGVEVLDECLKEARGLLAELEDADLLPTLRKSLAERVVALIRAVDEKKRRLEEGLSVEAPVEAVVYAGSVNYIHVKVRNENSLPCVVEVLAEPAPAVRASPSRLSLRGGEAGVITLAVKGEEKEVRATLNAKWSHGLERRERVAIKLRAEARQPSSATGQPEARQADAGAEPKREAPRPPEAERRLSEAKRELEERQPPPAQERRQQAIEAPPSPNAGVLVRHVFAAVLGALVGRAFPEKVYRDKPVYVQDMPYYVDSERRITYVFEDETNVVVEDRGEYILLRRAKPDELLSWASAKAAKRLIEDFKHAALSALKKANIYPGGVKITEEDLTAEALREVAAARGEDIAKLAERVPPLFKIVARYGGLFKKTGVVVVASCARVDRYAARGFDHERMSLGEALSLLGLKGDEGLLVLASPTGWTPDAVEKARRMGAVLVDLKQGVAYYDEGDQRASAVVAELGLTSSAPYPVDKTLDKMLLEGEIDENTYRQYIRGTA